MQNKLFYLLLYIVMGVLSSCHPDKHKIINLAEPKFTTSDASELFFKNIRQSYYEKTEMKEAKLDVYRMKENTLDDTYPQLYPTIVINWRYDEAYVLLEPNAPIQDLDTLKIIWEDTINNKKGYYVFLRGNKSDHYQMATHLYNSIQEHHQLYVLQENNHKTEFLPKPANRDTFRKIMFDYYRLVDLL
jgi:hypothetical protein